jgi:chromosome partitioning protein
MLTAVRESGKPFGFVLNQVQARSPRPSGAAGSLAKRAVELKMAHVLALPAIVLRNGQQDAVGIGLGVTEHAPRGKSAEEIRELWRWICTRLGLQPVTEAPAQTHAPMPIAATPEDVTAALPAPS